MSLGSGIMERKSKEVFVKLLIYEARRGTVGGGVTSRGVGGQRIQSQGGGFCWQIPSLPTSG